MEQSAFYVHVGGTAIGEGQAYGLGIDQFIAFVDGVV